MRARVQGACVLAAITFTTASTTAAPPNDAELREHGKLLSAQCMACHRTGGTDNGVPPIVGWPAEDFIWVFKTYRDGGRIDPGMVHTAQWLDDKQIRALARFFGSLKTSIPPLR